MAKSDLLSRRAGHEKGENDNADLTLLKPEFFRNTTLETVDSELIQRIKPVKSTRDAAVGTALANKEKDWLENPDGIVTWHHRIYVPKDSKL